MNTLTNEEKMMIMQQAMNNVESELEKTGYIKYITGQEFESMAIEEYHNLISKLYFNRANKIG